MKTFNHIIKALCTTALIAHLFTACSLDDLNTDPYNPVYSGGGNEQKPDTTGTGKFDDLNINYDISEQELATLKAGEGQIGALFKTYTYKGLYDDYQRTTNLTHDTYCGYVASNNPAFSQGSPNYVYTEGWSGLRWTHFYNDRTVREYAQLLKTFHFITPEKYHNAFYITRIYWAFLASMNTDTYGDMPILAYVQAKTPDGKNVKFDTQQTCYDVIFRLLEQAVDSIRPNNEGFKFSNTEDLCYGGDIQKWLRFANTLRLRLALRISNVDPERARTEGEAALASPYGMLQNDGDNMRTIPWHAPADLGGIGASGDENVLAMCSFAFNGDCVMSKDLELTYKNQSTGGTQYQIIDPGTGSATSHVIDPRCAISWWRPTPMEVLKQGQEFPITDWTGCPVGSDDIDHANTVSKYSITRTLLTEDKQLNPKNWYSYSRESVWMSYAESRFLLAEAALRGWKGAEETPQQYFEEGIRASMKYYEIANADVESYINGLKIYKDDAQNPFKTGNKEGMLEQIITQKWLAVFPNGNEAWAEFRRTDYPKLLNIENNRTDPDDVQQGKFIKRVRYPFSMDVNPNNPIKTQNIKQGTRLWWDVADTNGADGKRNTPNNFR